MTVRTPSYLKTVFETGDIPVGSDYGDIFDSFVSLGVSSKQIVDGAFESTKELAAPHVSAGSLFVAGTFSASNMAAQNGTFSHILVNDISASAVYATRADVGTLNVTTISAGNAKFTGNVSASAIFAEDIRTSAIRFTRCESTAAFAKETQFVTAVFNNPATFQSDAIVQGNLVRAHSLNVDANGNVQSSATPVFSDINLIRTVAVANSGVILPTPVSGRLQHVLNTNTTATALLYPAVGSQIDSLGVNAALTVGPGILAIIIHASVDRYFSTRAP